MATRNKIAKASPRPDPLGEYKQKRDFERTAEPKPGRPDGGGSRFVVQKHAARRLHYDLRLELDGVLKSWAITKGPSLVVGEKRLAVNTEDHPLEYLEFEGNIPKGEYGGGAMIVWDRGHWNPEGDPHFGLTKGHLAFSLDGKRLKGRWHLVRIRPRRGEKTRPWLLIKAEDAFARAAGAAEITDEETTSELSGRTTEELAAQGELRSDHAARTRVTGARASFVLDVKGMRGAKKGLLPVFLAPSLAAPCDRPPSGARWLHEIKHDGYRMQAPIDADKVRLLTRTGLDWTARFARIAAALKEIGLSSAWLDGEIVVENADGVTSFNQLQADLEAGRQDRLAYFVFDLLYCDGYDLTKVSLLERKALLGKIIGTVPPDSPLRFSEHLDEDGPTVFRHTCRLGLEGIVSKRADLPYRPGRGDHWLKSKCMLRQEFVIIGYIPSTAAPGAVGALLLGYYEEGKLIYAGRVGTGYSSAQARALRSDLENIEAKRPAFGKPLPAGADKGVRWAEPHTVCDVEYRGITEQGLIRQASFKGLRQDKPAEQVVLEQRPRPTAALGAPDLAGVVLTHPDRILWDEPGVTKRGLADFYADIARWILPHIVDRPLSLFRCPSGIGEPCFFAKHPWQGLSKGIRTVDVGESEPMLAIEDLSGLIGLVQAGVVEIHPWGSRTGDLERPDRLIFDLDPGDDVPWGAVVAAALEVRDRLQDLGLRSFVKTSGGKGLHVMLPTTPGVGWDGAKAFTRSIAEAMEKAHPERYIAVMTKRARRGRIFIDYLRNGRGATAVAAYSTRARPGAPVSVPLAWDELSESVRADHFTIGNLRQRLDFLKADQWQDFFKVRQRIPG